jgi:transcriptional regulator with XRE-family HTH domain
MPEPIDVDRIGKRLRRIRVEQGCTLQGLSQVTGISVPTLSRVERGGSKEIEAGTLVAICEWMGAKPAEFSLGTTPPKAPGRNASVSTPEAVELYLRADKKLDPKTAALLAEMFRAAYEKAANR